MSDPKCPYCGKRMDMTKIEGGQTTYRFVCRSCGSISPCARTRDKARKLAFDRPNQKPLMIDEIADMTIDLDINALLERAGMQPYTHDTLSETFILRLALKRVLDERDALLRDVSNNCFVCANRKTDEKGICVNAGGGIGCSHFVWRGPQPKEV